VEKDKKEGDKNMDAILEKKSDTAFANFMKKNKKSIRENANLNTKRNKDGLTIIVKDDEWLKETEWDKYHKELKDK